MSDPLVSDAAHRATMQALTGRALDVAPLALGGVLRVRDDDGRVVAVRLTEVEAYEGSTDPGSHAFRGPTPRTAPMFGPPGRLYVYFTYGVHWCANVVCGADGTASALLLRAGEVIEGGEVAREHRMTGRMPGRVRTDADLARGPANLARCVGLTGEDSGLAFDPDGRAALELPATPVDPADVRTGPRVGVSGIGGDGSMHPWRYWIAGEPSVSAYRAAVTRRRRGGGAAREPA